MQGQRPAILASVINNTTHFTRYRPISLVLCFTPIPLHRVNFHVTYHIQRLWKRRCILSLDLSYLHFLTSDSTLGATIPSVHEGVGKLTNWNQDGSTNTRHL
ncbi:unnamed protein product [Dicrocoelium dendriticum]|nr:unnamed protein product [Dicrocoelium dendriticum]